jgi:pyruvate kinase
MNTGKPVVTATQMLESMINNPRPTRAECSDVANAVYDGTDCVMLSGETANGAYFEQAVQVMAKTCCEAESSRNYNALFQSIRNSTLADSPDNLLSPSESLASSAVKTAIDVDAKLIVVVSVSGNMGRLLAKFRPGRFVIVLTDSATVARQCSGVLNGVRAYVLDSLENTDEMVKQVVHEALRVKLVHAGDLMVGVWGKTFGQGKSDTVQIHVCNPATSRLNFGFYDGLSNRKVVSY